MYVARNDRNAYDVMTTRVALRESLKSRLCDQMSPLAWSGL